MNDKKVFGCLLGGVSAIIFVPAMIIVLKMIFSTPLRQGVLWSAHVIEWKVGNKSFSPLTVDEHLTFHQDSTISGGKSQRFMRWSLANGKLIIYDKESKVQFKFDGLNYVAYLSHPDRKSPYCLRVEPTGI